MENFMKIIRMLRVQHGISQEKAAKKLGVSQPQLHKYESGEKDIPLTKFVNYARILHIDPIKLLNYYCICESGVSTSEQDVLELSIEIKNNFK